MPEARFLVYTRDDCPLCDEFVAELSRLPLRYELRDVDGDPVTLRRYGLKVPVLICDGRIVCHGRLDRVAVLRVAGG